MRNNIFSLLAVFTLIAFASCNDELDKKVSMDVTATAENAEMDGNTLVVEKGRMVTFNISGNPDFITFFSGESGHEYEKRNLTETPIEEIGDSRLEFYTKTQYGSVATVANTLKVYVSTTFEGLYKNDKVKDSTIVANAFADGTWIDITDLCEIPQAPNKTSDTISVSMNEYLGKRFAIAFKYETKDNSGNQPRWEVHNLKIINTSKETGEELGFVGAANFGFTPLNMFATTNDDAYKTVTNNTEGVWNLNNLQGNSPYMFIHSSGSGKPLKHVWLISSAVVINGRQPDAGVGIKTISNNPVTNYNHTYEKAGEYTVTFIAKNANFENTSEVKKELKIKVIE